MLGMAQTEEARYNYYHKSITRNADGSTDYRVSFSITMFTHTAMNSTYGQTFITYNPQYQEVKVNEAYTIRKNGTKIALPTNALVQTIPSFAQKASDFNHLREFIVVHTGLDIGCTAYLDYTVHSKPGFNKHFDYNETVDMTSPITDYSLVLAVPASEKLQQSLYSPNGKVSATSDQTTNGQRVITYSLKNLPARSREGFQVSDITRQWRYLTTMSDFETEVRELFYGPIDPTISAWGKEQVAKEPEVIKRYNYIRKHVADNYTTTQIPFNQVWSVRPYAQIKKGAYITPAEQAVVLNQMLRSCNILSDVQVSFAPSLPKEFRTLNNAQRFVVTQQMGDEPKALDPGNANGSASAPLLVSLKGEKATPATPQVINRKRELSVDASKLNAEGYYLMQLPTDGCPVGGWYMQTLPTLRETAFEIPSIIDDTQTYVIKTDGKVKLAGSYSTNYAAQGGVVLTETASEAADGTITVVRHIVLPKKVYSVEEYSAAREAIMTWLSSTHQRLLFVKK